MFEFDKKPFVYAQLVHPEYGYDMDKENAKKLDVGEYYEVAHISMSQSSTTIQLKDVNGGFNSVQFEFFDKNKKKIDIYSMPEFNNYLAWRFHE
jgi:hypothetical protein